MASQGTNRSSQGAPGANEVVLPLSFEPGDEVAFEVVADAP